MKPSTNSDGFRRWHEAGTHMPPTDIQVITSEGQSIAAHSSVLDCASPVLERMIDRSFGRRNSERTIKILGVPFDAVLAFVQFLYSSKTALSSKDGEAAMDRHGVQLLALAHKFRVGWLKSGSEAAVAARLNADAVVDTLKLAKMCDAPRLYQACARLAIKDFAAVRASDAWRFVRRHDAALELEFLQLVEEAEQRKKKWKRERAAQEVYQQLSEAMDCLEHIFSEGCTAVGTPTTTVCNEDDCPWTPVGTKTARAEPCKSGSTCQGLQLLMRHFAICAKNKKLSPGSCMHCKRMWQLIRLHSSVCDHPETCRVPLCNQLKIKMEAEEKVDKTWKLLVKKVIRAKVMSSLANRNTPEIVLKSWAKYQGRTKLRPS